MQHLIQLFEDHANTLAANSEPVTVAQSIAHHISQKLASKKRYKLFIKQDGMETYLTKKEVIIISLLMQGFRAKQIAWELKSSLHTVNTHLSNIKDKFNCNNIFHLGLILGKYRPQLEAISEKALSRQS